MERWFDGDKARGERLARGLTQGAVAAAAQVSQSHLSGIELGRRQPSPPVGERLAAALEIDLRALMLREPTS